MSGAAGGPLVNGLKVFDGARGAERHLAAGSNQTVAGVRRLLQVREGIVTWPTPIPGRGLLILRAGLEAQRQRVVA
jgi:hypothetical protein